ncbi:ABC-2 transporter permease [Mammaliicoccus sciuri]|uniref:ABC-2 transporter permease n=1 Tax=Mammaliicoccus sciuri TaxID=1296 RepID=UPI00226F2598|nr:ABC-2 transporter permease [Mammaliicoccus sciuri]MCY1051173.1 ABC-2 transporter permease [Mammaliicoccus sciuri]
MKAVFYRNFQYEKGYYLLYLICFGLVFITKFTVSFQNIELMNVLAVYFVAVVSVHSINHAIFLNKQSSQIFYMSLPISKVDIVKGHYLYNLLVTGVSFIMIMVIAFIKQDTIFLQAGLSIVATNLFTLSIVYPTFAHLNINQLGAWILVAMYGIFTIFYFGIYSNRSRQFADLLGWKIFLYYTPAIRLLIVERRGGRQGRRARNQDKNENITVYGGIK